MTSAHDKKHLNVLGHGMADVDRGAGAPLVFLTATRRRRICGATASPIPKLFINAEPVRSLTGELREACRRWPNQTEVTVRGLHYIQEDSPAQIAGAIASFAELVC